MGTNSTRGKEIPRPIRTLQIILLLLVSIISYGALVIPFLLDASTTTLQVGDVSPDNYLAPRTLRYESTIRTDEAQLDAVNAVPPVYASPDPAIARRESDR